MKVNPLIFREYDVRGKVGEDLTEDIVEHLGKAYGTYLKQNGYKQIVVGRDGRLSSPRLKDALVKGILSTGCGVTDVGMCPTPVVYFSIFHLDKEGGIAVTGSHNPPEYNGFKSVQAKRLYLGNRFKDCVKLWKREITKQDKEVMTLMILFLTILIF